MELQRLQRKDRRICDLVRHLSSLIEGGEDADA